MIGGSYGAMHVLCYVLYFNDRAFDRHILLAAEFVGAGCSRTSSVVERCTLKLFSHPFVNSSVFDIYTCS